MVLPEAGGGLGVVSDVGVVVVRVGRERNEKRVPELGR